MKHFVLLAGLLGLGLPAALAQPAAPDLLPSGPYAVGFRVVRQYDHTRAAQPRVDFEGRRTKGETALPVTLFVWYPAARTAGAARMRYADYLYAGQEHTPGDPLPDEVRASLGEELQRRAPFALGRALSEAEVEAILASETQAMRDAPPADGPFPVVAGGLEGPESSSVLAEHLAGHGYVVVTTPSNPLAATMQTNQPQRAIELHARNIEYVLGQLPTLPFADPGRVGLVGLNFNGMAALVVQMRLMRADAVVSLDGWEGKGIGSGTLRENLYFEVRRLRVPYLLFTQDNPPTPQIAADLSLFDDLVYAERSHYVAGGLEHIHYVGNTAAWALTWPDRGTGYAFVYETVRRFLDAHVRKDPEAAAWLRRGPAENGFPADVLQAQVRREALPPVPTAEEFEALVMEERDVEKAARLWRAGTQADPDLVLFLESTLNLFAFRFGSRGEHDLALALYRLNTEAYPDSPNAWNNLGNAQRDLGQTEAARQSFERALALLATADMSEADRARSRQVIQEKLDGLDR